MMGLMLMGRQLDNLVSDNLTSVATTDVNHLDQGQARRLIWQANWQGAQEFPLLGTGLGSHREVYWTWFDHPHDGGEYSHAENGYLQLALETGLTGLSLMIATILIVLSWCIRGLRAVRLEGKQEALTSKSPEVVTRCGGPLAAVTASLVINLVQSCWDFVWYVPAISIYVLLLAAAACRLSRLIRTHNVIPQPVEEHASFVMPRIGWLSAGVAAIAFAAWLAPLKIAETEAEPFVHEFVRLATQSEVLSRENQEQLSDLLRRRASAIWTAARKNPHDHRSQIQAGSHCLDLFQLIQDQGENAMPLTQIRDAARDAGFKTAADRDAWLKKPGVLGKNLQYLTAADRYLRRGLRLCPMQSQGYLKLTDLLWLKDPSPEAEQRLMDQALAVRPYDPETHKVCGMLAARDEDLEGALKHWRIAFDRDPYYRPELIHDLAKIVPAAFFLDNFNLDLISLQHLRGNYQDAPDQVGYRKILSRLAKMEVEAARKSEGKAACDHWREAMICYGELGDQGRCTKAAEQALAVEPNDFELRWKYGVYLMNWKKYARAAEHLVWCSRRRVDDQQMQVLAERAVSESHRMSSSDKDSQLR